MNQHKNWKIQGIFYLYIRVYSIYKRETQWIINDQKKYKKYGE